MTGGGRGLLPWLREVRPALAAPLRSWRRLAPGEPRKDGRSRGSADCSCARPQGRRLSEKELRLLGAGPPRRAGGAEPIRRQDSSELSPSRPGPESKAAAGVAGNPEQGSAPLFQRAHSVPTYGNTTDFVLELGRVWVYGDIS